jgi:hypothetical protein
MSDMDKDILLQIRTMMITIMQNQHFSISKSVMMIFYILLDIYQKVHSSALSFQRDVGRTIRSKKRRD